MHSVLQKGGPCLQTIHSVRYVLLETYTVLCTVYPSRVHSTERSKSGNGTVDTLRNRSMLHTVLYAVVYSAVYTLYSTVRSRNGNNTVPFKGIVFMCYPTDPLPKRKVEVQISNGTYILTSLPKRSVATFEVQRVLCRSASVECS